MTTSSGKNNGNAERVRQWFRENPDEYLTYDDCRIKFPELTKAQLHVAMAYLRRSGFVVIDHVVQAGPKLTGKTGTYNQFG